MASDIVSRAAVMDAVCNAYADALEKRNVSVAVAIIDAINSVPTLAAREIDTSPTGEPI
ncbi:hypothetical protein ACQKE8_12855 [Sphingobium limneticum]|uniref:hypothetical protein n=1 Tax=Sphingobium limneticum TaxID=1007511 RepID=UPI003D0403C7